TAFTMRNRALATPSGARSPGVGPRARRGAGPVRGTELYSAPRAGQRTLAARGPATIGQRRRRRALLPSLVHGRTRRGGAMATMSDIAREAGVSLSTVSYALSGKRTISESTRERINAAIPRLSYHPHAGARALASQCAGAIGLAVPLAEDVDAHVVMMFVRSLMRAAHQASSEVLLVTGEDHEATLRVLAEGKVDALVVMDVVEDDPRIPDLATAPRPVVLLGYPTQAQGIPRVDFDFEQATALAVTELHRRGAHRLVMIGSPSATQTRHATYADRATRGFRTACQNLGVSAHHLVHDHEVESTG